MGLVVAHTMRCGSVCVVMLLLGWKRTPQFGGRLDWIPIYTEKPQTHTHTYRATNDQQHLAYPHMWDGFWIVALTCPSLPSPYKPRQCQVYATQTITETLDWLLYIYICLSTTQCEFPSLPHTICHSDLRINVNSCDGYVVRRSIPSMYVATSVYNITSSLLVWCCHTITGGVQA